MNTRAVPQPVQAMLISTIVLATLFSGLILALNDNGLNSINLPNPIGTLVAVVSRTPIGTQASPPTAGTPTPASPTPVITETATPPTPTATPTPVCPPPPPNWSPVFYNQAETTLFLLAQHYNTTLERLIEVNCLDRAPLQAMQWLYVPAAAPVFVPTPVSVACYPPLGWQAYRVQYGDTLYGLAVRFNVSVNLLIRYNCLNTTTIYYGQRLYVPYTIPIATFTPWPTWTPIAITATPSPTPILITETPIVLPTETPIVLPTETPIVLPTETPIVLPTETPIVLPTETPIVLPTETASVLPTLTPTVAGVTPPPTQTPTLPPAPTSTPLPTAVPPTTLPPTAVPPTSVPPTAVPPTSVPPGTPGSP